MVDHLVASLFSPQNCAQRRLDMLHIGILLNHADLVFVQESVNIRTLFDEFRT